MLNSCIISWGKVSRRNIGYDALSLGNQKDSPCSPPLWWLGSTRKVWDHFTASWCWITSIMSNRFTWLFFFSPLAQAFLICYTPTLCSSKRLGDSSWSKIRYSTLLISPNHKVELQKESFISSIWDAHSLSLPRLGADNIYQPGSYSHNCVHFDLLTCACLLSYRNSGNYSKYIPMQWATIANSGAFFKKKFIWLALFVAITWTLQQWWVQS